MYVEFIVELLDTVELLDIVELPDMVEFADVEFIMVLVKLLGKNKLDADKPGTAVSLVEKVQRMFIVEFDAWVMLPVIVVLEAVELPATKSTVGGV